MQPYLNLLGYRAASESEIDEFVDQFEESRESGICYTVRDAMAPVSVTMLVFPLLASHF